jgi:hypothetical protein
MKIMADGSPPRAGGVKNPFKSPKLRIATEHSPLTPTPGNVEMGRTVHRPKTFDIFFVPVTTESHHHSMTDDHDAAITGTYTLCTKPNW